MRKLKISKTLFKILLLLRKLSIMIIIILSGTVIISLFKFLEIIRKVIKLYRQYPHLIVFSIILIFIIPLVSIIVEKGYRAAMEKNKH